MRTLLAIVLFLTAGLRSEGSTTESLKGLSSFTLYTQISPSSLDKACVGALKKNLLRQEK